MTDSSLEDVIARLRSFVAEREWQQFHDPKNLAMLIVSEAGELAAELRWIHSGDADAHARRHRTRIAEEAADVDLGLLLLCDRVGIDLVEAMRTKIETNRMRYPAESARGVADRPEGI